MAKIWVLDTETKGTGANMVPLEKVQSNPASQPRPLKRPGPRPRPAERPPEATAPREFKIVDVMTREVLADGVGARAAVERLEEVRSVVDVNVYVWEPAKGEWRLLGLGEQQALWAHRRPQSD
jgi:hypothetical protein